MLNHPLVTISPSALAPTPMPSTNQALLAAQPPFAPTQPSGDKLCNPAKAPTSQSAELVHPCCLSLSFWFRQHLRLAPIAPSQLSSGPKGPCSDTAGSPPPRSTTRTTPPMPAPVLRSVTQTKAWHGSSTQVSAADSSSAPLLIPAADSGSAPNLTL
ncbi:hypothetical protein NDA17_002436 [Ustilago hordei]|nr:hypothetical protein NDA17_002436 [Ustilago hordei]